MSLKSHQKSDLIKWIITAVVGVLLIATVVGLCVKLNKVDTTKTISKYSYEVGIINDLGKEKTSDGSIRSKDFITVDGLAVVLSDDANITYRLYFYDEDEKFISSTQELSADFNGTVPSSAKYAKLVITPVEDEDGKVSFLEVYSYASQLTVTVNK
jgi:hypothetical protein